MCYHEEVTGFGRSLYYVAAPLNNDQLLAALKSEGGINLREWPNWRDLCRCHNGSHQKGGPTIRAWDQSIGVYVHITAGDLGSRTPERYISDILINDPAVPLKCQFAVDPYGVTWLLSGGRCNHALYLGEKAWQAFLGETWRTDTPYDDRRGNERVGSSFTYGIENITSTTPNALQRQQSLLICAAINRAHGWSGNSVAGHGECSSDRTKADPNMDMGAFRRDVTAQVKNKGDDVGQVDSFSDAALRQLYGYQVPYIDPATGKPATGGKTSQDLSTTLSWWEASLVGTVNAARDATIKAVDAAADRIIANGGGGLTKQDVTDAVNEALASQMKFSGALVMTPVEDK